MRDIFHVMNRLGKACTRAANQVQENNNQKNPHHARMSSAPPKDLVSFAEEYRKLAIDCLKVLRVEMQLETIFNLQVCDIYIGTHDFFPLNEGKLLELVVTGDIWTYIAMKFNRKWQTENT